MTLFSSQTTPPLPYILEARDFNEFFGQEHLVGEGKTLRKLIEKDKLFSSVFWGPCGSGKTLLAKLIARKTNKNFIKLNAVNLNVAKVRETIKKAEEFLNFQGQKTLVLIDEIHRFNKLQQDSLLQAVEEGKIILIGATSENPYYYLNTALLSRSMVFEFKKHNAKSIYKILKGALKKYYEEREIEDAVLRKISSLTNDARKALITLEAIVISSGKNQVINLESCGDIIKSSILYSRDEKHYDYISAFIKSVRGGDTDAALYYLALMLEGGEDPLFIVRRLIIAASEDIGTKDNFALVMASSLKQAVELVGMPEASIMIAHVVCYLCAAPKGNKEYKAVTKAISYVKNNPPLEIPDYLKDKSYKPGLKNAEYIYPHDNNTKKQDYLSKKLKFYE